MKAFRERVAIVTGGASGIGRCLCLQLAGHGARLVVVADRHEERGREVVGEIEAAGGKARFAPLDVCDAAAVQELVEGTARDAGSLDYLFNNAGISVMGEVRDQSLEDWLKVIDVNLNGVVHGVHAAYQVMLAQGSGHIVNTASLAGLVPAPLLTPYCATKHAVVGLSTALRAEGQQLGVRVSAVCPGFIRTRIMTESPYRNLDQERSIRELPFVVTPERCARTILKGVARNKAVIVVAGHAHVIHFLYRHFPGLVRWLIARNMRRSRERLRSDA